MSAGVQCPWCARRNATPPEVGQTPCSWCGKPLKVFTVCSHCKRPVERDPKTGKPELCDRCQIIAAEEDHIWGQIKGVNLS